jgi:phenylacetate-CoA ligase
VLVVSIEVRRGVDPDAACEALQVAVRDKFGVTPKVVVLETGTLAREFEAAVKMPRFADRRQ